MKLFHGTTASTGSRLPPSALRHFGTKLAAMHRLESIFASQPYRVYDGGDVFTATDLKTGVTALETLNQSLETFCTYMSSKHIEEFDVGIYYPLRLTDCWGDDPIGSCGLELFRDNADLTSQQRRSLAQLFFPFTGVNQPYQVHELLNRKTIKAILQWSMKNALFKAELNKRKKRLRELGIDESSSLDHEAVWIHLTLKLRLWAISNNFDSFVYQNVGEGNGEDSFVTLQPGQISQPTNALRFDANKYWAIVAPKFKEFLEERAFVRTTEDLKGDAQIHRHCFWCGLDPIQFWN